MAQVIISVPMMSTDHDAEGVQRAVESLPGISQLSINLDGKQILVEFDESQISTSDLQGVIESEGFDSEVL